MRKAAKRAYLGVRAIILIPLMIIGGLLVYVYDKATGRR